MWSWGRTNMQGGGVLVHYCIIIAPDCFILWCTTVHQKHFIKYTTSGSALLLLRPSPAMFSMWPCKNISHIIPVCIILRKMLGWNYFCWAKLACFDFSSSNLLYARPECWGLVKVVALTSKKMWPVEELKHASQMFPANAKFFILFLKLELHLLQECVNWPLWTIISHSMLS
jgi:hypothetical protein